MWRPVIGFKGIYEVSDLGRVRSLSRAILGGPRRNIIGIIRKTPITGQYPAFICRNGTKTFSYVHHLVAEAFIGRRPIDKEVVHADGNPKTID